MFGLFKKNAPVEKHNSLERDGDKAIIDVRGQTCPSFLFHINKHAESLESGIATEIFSTHERGDIIVRAWCEEKGHNYINTDKSDDFSVVCVQLG